MEILACANNRVEMIHILKGFNFTLRHVLSMQYGILFSRQPGFLQKAAAEYKPATRREIPYRGGF